MAFLFTPANTVSARLNETIDTHPLSLFDMGIAPQHGSRSLIFAYPLDANVSIKRIDWTLAETNGNAGGTNRWDLVTMFAKIYVLRGYKKELVNALFDPFYTPKLLALIGTANVGNVPTDAVSPVADVKADSEAVIVNHTVTRVGSGHIKLDPPAENMQDKNLVVIFTPVYTTGGVFWAGGNPATSYPKWANWVGGSLNTGGFVDYTGAPCIRTLRVSGCQK